MWYQLPTGKVIQITLDQYLDLTDEDIQYLISINYGDYVRNPFHGSATKSKKKRKVEDEDVEIDTGIDFSDEDEDKSHNGAGVIEEIPLDDLPDIPDPSTRED